MGIMKLFSTSSLNKSTVSRSIIARNLSVSGASSQKAPRKQLKSGNPNPWLYKITKSEVIGTYLLLWVNYPDCKNYEGNKILLFQGVTLATLKKQKAIDPHFSDSQKYHHPIARFVPTEEGWAMAQEIAKLRSK